MIENKIIESLKDYAEKVNHAVFFQINENGAKELYETLISALNYIYNLQAEKEALIAGQETLQKALAAKITDYEALKADEEREHQYCKNVCEPKYKAKIADEKAKGDICASVNKRQDKELERFKKIETAINKLWDETQKLATFKNKRKPTLEELLEYIENLKDEAIKEFVERLKAKSWQGMWEGDSHVEVDDIDNLVKEMVGDTE